MLHVKHLDAGLSELWFAAHQCQSVAEAIRDAATALEARGAAQERLVSTIDGLAGAAVAVARQACERAEALQRRLAEPASPPAPPAA
jgi:uncharacterized metal-binding protein